MHCTQGPKFNREKIITMPTKGLNFFTGLGKSVDDNSTISVNSIVLLASAMIGVLIGLTMCFVLIYDVITNGYLKTDLIDAGIFLLSSGGYILGSGMPKTIVDTKINSKLQLRRKSRKIDGREYVDPEEDITEETEEES